MPRLNTLGGAVMGIAGVPLSVDGSTPAVFSGIPSGGWDWYTDAVIFGQADFGSGFEFYTYDTGTDTLSASLGAADVNETFAGGSVYAWFRAGTGVVTSIPTAYPLAGLADVSPDGRTVVIQNSQADRGLQVFDATGNLLLSVDTLIDTGGTIHLRGDILAWKDQNTGWNLYNVGTGQPIGFMAQNADVNTVIPVTMTNGQIALVERDATERVTVRYSTAQLGYVLNTAAVFDVDAIEFSAGVVRVAWSTTTGEGPNDLQEIDITLANGANQRGVVSGGTVVFSSRPAIPTSSLPGTPAGPTNPDAQTGPLGAILEGIYRQPMVETSRIVVRPWYLFFLQIIRSISQPVQAGNIQGVLGAAQGGTGVTTGLTQLNASNLTMGNLPIARFNNGTNAGVGKFWQGDGEFGSWQPVAGSGAVTGPGSSLDGQIVLFDGTTGDVIKGATGSGVVFATDGVYSVGSIDSAGTWSILTNGDGVSPEIIFDSFGDVISTFIPA